MKTPPTKRIGKLEGAMMQVLLKLMVDSATPASGRIRAALGIFGIAQEGFNMEIETRVAALERAAELAKSSGK